MFIAIVLSAFLFFLLLNARSRISRLEHRITLLEQSAANNLYGKVVEKSPPVVSPTAPAVHATSKPAPIVAPKSEPAKLAARVIYASTRPEDVQSAEVPEQLEALPEETVQSVTVKQAISEIVKPAKRTTPIKTAKPEREETDLSRANGGNSNNTVPPSSPSAPPPPAPPHPAPPTPPPAAKRPAFNFEEFFGRRLPIWAGGITLAIAGVLIVKYAYDAGLLSRWVQVIGGLLFGTSLIAGAEVAFRKEVTVRDPRVRQALSGAGLATLYATVLVAHNAYALISPLTAFIAMAAITAGALGLSVRFGAPSALLGLAGGLATPALVGSLQPDVPMLSLYLALTIGGLTAVSRSQRWAWLGVSALIGGAGWGAYLIATSALDFASSLSIGGFVILLAIGFPFVAFTGPRASIMRAASALIGAAQIATLVAVGGYSALHWGLFGLIAVAGQWLSWREKGFEIVPSISLGISAMLLLVWPDPELSLYILVGISMTIIHGVPLLIRVWKVPARVQTALELTGLSCAILIIPMIQFYALDGSRDTIFGLLSLIGGMIAALAIALGWRSADRLQDIRFAMLTTISAFLGVCAYWFVGDQWTWPIALGVAAAIVLLFGHWAADPRLEKIAAIFAALTLPLIVVSRGNSFAEIASLFGHGDALVDLMAVIRWLTTSALFVLFAVRAQSSQLRFAATIAAALLGYGTLAQIAPGWAVPIALGASVATLLAVSRSMGARTEYASALIAAASVPLLIISAPDAWNEWSRLFGNSNAIFSVESLIRWSGVAAVFALFAVRAQSKALRYATQAVAAALMYGVLAQIVSPTLLPLAPAAGVLALAFASQKYAWPKLAPALSVATMIALAWTLKTGAIWLTKALMSLSAIPMLVDTGFPSATAFLNHLLIPAVFMGGAIWLMRDRLPRRVMLPCAVLVSLLALIGIHGLYRIGFAQIIPGEFAFTGLPQRLIWAALLIASGWGVWKQYAQSTIGKPLAVALICAGTLHSVYYSLLLHNPLWAAQAVGGLPVVNLLIPLFGTVPLCIGLLGKIVPSTVQKFDRLLQVGAMVLVTLFVYASLRQIFHGTFLISSETGDVEDILRSIIAIALAIGFLLWGIRNKQRDWRIASLILMIAAVGKVFLLDASGLQGLMRIGSFVALGFSLIGLGWLYSRQLRGPDTVNEVA